MSKKDTIITLSVVFQSNDMTLVERKNAKSAINAASVHPFTNPA
jgi:hypothetical protein